MSNFACNQTLPIIYILKTAPPLSYFRGSRPGSYADAAAQCASEGTTLASIGTESDWNDARTVCGAMDCWIGSRDDRHGNDEMIFSWDDGTDITTSYGFNANKTATTGQGPWYAGQPDESHGTEEDCVAMYHTYETGKYVDAQCINHYYPLCNKGRCINPHQCAIKLSSFAK